MTSDSFWKKEKFQLYRNKGKGYPTQRQLKRQLPSGAMCWKEHWPRSWQDRAWSSAPPLAPEWPWESPRASALFLFICKMERIKAFHIGFLWQNIQLKPINCPTQCKQVTEYSRIFTPSFAEGAWMKAVSGELGWVCALVPYQRMPWTQSQEAMKGRGQENNKAWAVLQRNLIW